MIKLTPDSNPFAFNETLNWFRKVLQKCNAWYDTVLFFLVYSDLQWFFVQISSRQCQSICWWTLKFSCTIISITFQNSNSGFRLRPGCFLTVHHCLHYFGAQIFLFWTSKFWDYGSRGQKSLFLGNLVPRSFTFFAITKRFLHSSQNHLLYQQCSACTLTFLLPSSSTCHFRFIKAVSSRVMIRGRLSDFY